MRREMSQDVTFDGKTVLLVEDELFLAEKISGQLETLGVATVLTAVDLAEAESHVRVEQIDLALLDVNLPEGETTIDLGLALSRDAVPVVYFSGVSAPEVEGLSRSFEFLEKPLSVPRLKASMQRAILRVPALSPRAPKKMAGQEARQ